MTRPTKQIASGYPDINHDQFSGRIRPYLSVREQRLVEAAYVFAKYGHRNQTRDDGQMRYFDHVRAVAWILIDELKIFDCRMIIMALLHDIEEDSYILGNGMLEQIFGQRIGKGVALLTKRPKECYIDRLIKEGSWHELFVKVADRLHNVRTLYNCPPDKQQKQMLETRDIYLPLAEELIVRAPRYYKAEATLLRNKLVELCRQLQPDLIESVNHESRCLVVKRGPRRRQYSIFYRQDEGLSDPVIFREPNYRGRGDNLRLLRLISDPEYWNRDIDWLAINRYLGKEYRCRRTNSGLQSAIKRLAAIGAITVRGSHRSQVIRVCFSRVESELTVK